MQYKFTSTEMATNGTVTVDLRRKGSSSNSYTKMTIQVIDGAVAPIAGTITINAKVDADNPSSSFQKIGEFDLTAKVPLFIQGTYEELQFVGATMTATSTAFLVIAATR